ncbi:CDK-activating kinase assembly factor MAT1-domain-containing protein [Xylariaceae sp. FL1019]|nr:CDK-activating kinase assembly factor MAT1-domain-containing protein [Xylariaceae sp. FL1019]
MSRKPTGSTVVKPSNGGLHELPSDMCPVCKRVRYLNTDMEFLINPECYHAMCSNCVSNIFKSGPAQCPYASCTKTLRQRGFRSAFFGDLSIEREVDIRRRVAAAYNNVEDDFETLLDYNNYLQDVEELCMDLVSGGDAERSAAEQKLLHRESEFKAQIEANKQRGKKEEANRASRLAAEAKASELRRAQEREEDERAMAERNSLNASLMQALAAGKEGAAAKIQAKILRQKEAASSSLKSMSSIRQARRLKWGTGSTPSEGKLTIRGLKIKNERPAFEDDESKPYDPFAGLLPALQPTRYKLRSYYEYGWLDKARNENSHRAGGYDSAEYVSRSLFEAFSGLGINIADEKVFEERRAQSESSTWMDVDDVF